MAEHMTLAKARAELERSLIDYDNGHAWLPKTAPVRVILAHLNDLDEKEAPTHDV